MFFDNGEHFMSAVSKAFVPPITQQLHSDCAPIAQQLPSDCTTTAQQLRSIEYFFQLKKCCNTILVDMAAARYSSDVLQMFYGSITEEENTNVPQPLPPDVVGVWKMDIP